MLVPIVDMTGDGHINGARCSAGLDLISSLVCQDSSEILKMERCTAVQLLRMLVFTCGNNGLVCWGLSANVRRSGEPWKLMSSMVLPLSRANGRAPKTWQLAPTPTATIGDSNAIFHQFSQQC